MHWLITDKGDQDARKLADRHYTRRTPGATGFVRNGQNLVFITEKNDAVWVTHRPAPGKAERQDGLKAWECALFRNESSVLSSVLIEEATKLTAALWGPIPKDGIITFVNPDKVKSSNPGFCFKKAGWTEAGASSDGKPMLRAPHMDSVPHWSTWQFKEKRGGLLRIALNGGETDLRRHPHTGRVLPSERERFEAAIELAADGCHEWRGSHYTNGRPRFSRRIASNIWRWEIAYRVAHELFVGPIPDGLGVCHKCDNGNCVNPEHFFLGTHKDNVQDAKRKKRLKGNKISKNAAVLSPGDVKDIRHIWGHGNTTGPELAKRFGVGVGAIQQIASGTTWKNLGGAVRRYSARESPVVSAGDAERFWKKVDKNGECWEWTAAIDQRVKYGRFNIGGTNLFAHRVAYVIQHGPIPPGHYVCHSCDNRKCVRGEHLTAQLPKGNAQDMVRKGRHYRGGPGPAWAERLRRRTR